MRRVIAWFVENPVAANLLMILVIAGGLVTATTIQLEVFPELDSRQVIVTVAYPGAAPEEVEEGITVLIEEEVHDLDGVKRVTSTATEGQGAVTVEVLEDADVGEVLDEVKTRVDAIDTFPEEAESPIIQEVVLRRQVIDVAIAGTIGERALKALGERVRDEIVALPGITQAELVSARPYEISIEVSEEDLRRHGLTFDHVAAAVRAFSVDLPGGGVKTAGGEILLRAKGRAYVGRDFELIPLLTEVGGSRVLLGDVATVIDGFAETDQWSRFDGEEAVLVQVFRVGDQNALAIADTVKEYVDAANARMPEGVSLTTWQDYSAILRSRLGLLLRNGASGLVLVFIVLALFLRFRLAFWVTAGIPMSFLGTVWVLPQLDVSINLISLFAFIVVLGIVVDDAIVVGENVHTLQDRGVEGRKAAILGTQEVAIPVIFAITTTVAAFWPMLTVPGTTGRIMRVIPIVVIGTLVFSVIESQLVLPAHVSHLRRQAEHGTSALGAAWRRFQGAFARALETFIQRVYRPSLEVALRWRYATVAFGVATLLTTVGLAAGGWIRFAFFPSVEADNVAATVTMPLGTPAEVTARAVQRLEAAALRVREGLEAEVGEPVMRHVLTSIGDQPFRTAQSQSGGTTGQTFLGAHLGEVNIELTPAEDREVGSEEIARRWREAAGAVPDAEEVSFTSSIFSTGDAISIRLAHADLAVLQAAADELRAELSGYPGVFDLTDSFQEGKREVRLRVLPTAESLGVSQADLARQVRQAFHGEEAQRIQRGRDEVKVMVRYPEEDRRTLASLEGMRVRLADGSELPFSAVADVEHGRGYATIRRSDRRRTIDVTGDVDESVVSAGEVVASVEASFMPELAARYPGLTYSLEGERREQQDTLAGLARGFGFAVILIYGLLAVPFRSYSQPLIIMTAIPFGFVGAVWGHVIMGLDLTVLSMFGLVALAGVVVNDSLVLVDFINRKHAAGMSLLEAVREAGAARFRPILLTSLTTFAGLTPLLLERSMQARFLIPMAVSLAFGVMFSTFITLVLVPAGTLILDDVHRLFRR